MKIKHPIPFFISAFATIAALAYKFMLMAESGPLENQQLLKFGVNALWLAPLGIALLFLDLGPKGNAARITSAIACILAACVYAGLFFFAA